MKNKKVKETFKNTIPVIVILYLIITILDYYVAIKIGFHSGNIVASRGLSSTIAVYLISPVGVITLTALDKNIGDSKNHKLIIIILSITFWIVDFYPFFLAVKAHF